jgi:hypothetical protein
MPFIYNVKFVCGQAQTKEFIVNPGIYTTEINILNFDNEKTAEILKLFIPVVLDNRAIGREPKFGKPLGKDSIKLPANTATMDDCLKITKALNTGNGLKIGFLKIESNLELAVTAVYTVMDTASKNVSIDVEEISGVKRL